MAYFGHCNATTGALLNDPPGGFESGDANYAFALKKADEIVCPGTGPQSVTSLAAYFKYATTHAHIRIALYTTATPRVLVCQHAAEVEVTSLTGSWVGGAQSLTWHNSYTTLTGGTSYIIVFSQDDNTAYPAYDTGTSGDSDYASGDYTGGFPDTLNAGSAWGLKYCLAVQVEPVASGQFARPSSDVADGGWTNQADSNTNLYASIDEVTASDTDYIKSGATPTDDAVTIGLSSVTYPTAGTVVMRVRAAWL